ncbi:MAG: B-glycosyltransferase [Chryseobacterium sp.]|jgi:glycosyltransferase involved in cell wall biosynthesis|nr:B-glycosyltransferase [Chryseobacterium sp.]
MTLSEVQNAIYERKICILIPTYNNEKTLRRVIDGVLEYTKNIIVINDGSTDSTSEILKIYSQISTINLPQNKGKGNGLKIGFRKAKELGYHHAITIDSDGQHYPDDIPVFVEALLNENEDVLLIGNRNMSQDGIPKKSSFGNRFSNFWFWFETGIKLEDTQSGYRLYPLHKIPKKYFTPKFEFEIEIIVRTAWRHIPVKNVPIKVLYDPAERVSHFRPFKDFTRISILNTILVFITLVYIIPRNFINNFKKKSFKRFIKEDVLESDGSNRTKAFSIALGVFIGLSPFWGFHTLLVISLSVLFKLNKVLAFVASNISLPPFIPFIIAASLFLGAPFVSGDSNIMSQELNFDLVKNNLLQYLIGSLILATTMSFISGIAAFLFLNKVSPENN